MIEALAAAVASGRVLDAILVIMVLEGVGLAAYHRATGRGVRPGTLVWTLLAGMALLLAMRLGMAGAWWGWVGLALALAGLLHLADLRRVWRG